MTPAFNILTRCHRLPDPHPVFILILLSPLFFLGGWCLMPVSPILPNDLALTLSSNHIVDPPWGCSSRISYKLWNVIRHPENNWMSVKRSQIHHPKRCCVSNKDYVEIQQAGKWGSNLIFSIWEQTVAPCETLGGRKEHFYHQRWGIKAQMNQYQRCSGFPPVSHVF